MEIFGIAPGRHCAQSAFRPAMVGIWPLLGSFHWSAFRRSAFGHAPTSPEFDTPNLVVRQKVLLS